MSFRASLQIVLVLLVLAITASPGQAADRFIDLDLSQGARTEIIEPNRVYGFELINRVPQHRYSVTIERTFPDIVAIPPPPGAAPAGASACPRFSAVEDSISKATDEAEVKGLVLQARVLLEEESCNIPGVVNLLRGRVRETRERLPEEYRLDQGEEIRITVSRPDGEGTKTWVFLFTTGARGRWLTSYGFTFLGQQDEEFFSRAAGDDGTFEIARKNTSGGEFSDLEFTPSLFYTWLPRRHEGRDWSPGLTFGLGFEDGDPAVFVGGSYFYNRFVSLVAGLAIHEQKRLNGEYRLGQSLSESLSAEALHEDKFGINYFVGVSFRFSAAPSSHEDDPPAPPAEPAEPAEPVGGGR